MTQQARRPASGFIRPPSPDQSAHRAGRVLPSVRVGALRPAARPSQPVVRRRPPARRRTPFTAYVFVAALVAALVFGVRALRQRTHTAATSAPAQAAARPRGAPSLWVDPQYVSRYQSQLEAFLAGRPGKFAVAAVDLNSGASLTTDADTPYRAASVNKLELVVGLYRRAVARQLDLDTTIALSEEDIQRYGTGTLQIAGAGQVLSWRDLARLLIEQSDNTASYVIGKKLGLPALQGELEGWGLKQTSLADNTTTTADVATLLSLLYARKLLPEAQTQEVLTLLQNTVWTDRLQTGVPATIPVAHKIGTDVNVFNDAALFLNGQRPYIVVALSTGADEGAAQDTLAQISRLAYQFEAGLPAVTRTVRR